MARVVLNQKFWNKRRVFVTGHTGFKGAWLSLWLVRLGAEVTGYSLRPPTKPSLFELLKLKKDFRSIDGDVRDQTHLQKAMRSARPQIVIHLAAQSLVRASYQDPVETYQTNVMGTVNVLESARQLRGVRAVINVTSDKCYENDESNRPYTEGDPMGGYDPYSSSKGASELVTAAYQKSFYAGKNLGLASARAGNVIGGGDWARDRLIPDFIRAIEEKKRVEIRNPGATRPWQFVLEPLSGYLMLAEKLYADPKKYSSAWNFGPSPSGSRPVSWIVLEGARAFRGKLKVKFKPDPSRHEAKALRLNSSKARQILNWRPRLSTSDAVRWTFDWYRGYLAGADMRIMTEIQIDRFERGGRIR